VEGAVRLRRAGEDGADEQADDLQPLDEQLALEAGPQRLAVEQAGGQQPGDAEVAQPVIEALRQQQADEDAAPRGVLPAGRGEQPPPGPAGALVIDQPHLAARALQPLIEARVTTGADHRHGESPSPSKDGRSADRYPLGAYNG